MQGSQSDDHCRHGYINRSNVASTSPMMQPPATQMFSQAWDKLIGSFQGFFHPGCGPISNKIINFLGVYEV